MCVQGVGLAMIGLLCVARVCIWFERVGPLDCLRVAGGIKMGVCAGCVEALPLLVLRQGEQGARRGVWDYKRCVSKLWLTVPYHGVQSIEKFNTYFLDFLFLS